MISKKPCLDNLLILNQNVVDAGIDSFESELSEFLNSIDPQIIDRIENYAVIDRNKDIKPSMQVEQQLFQKLELSYEKIKIYYTEHKITLPSPIPALPPIYAMIEAIRNSLMSLMYVNVSNQEIQELAKKYIIPCADNDEEIIPYKLVDPSDGMLQQAHAEINTYVNENKILNSQLTKKLESFPISINTERSDKRSNPGVELLSILLILIQSDFTAFHHRHFVEQFAEIDKNGQIKGLKPTDLFNDWNQELENLDLNKSTKFWYRWEKLKPFHMSYKNYLHQDKKLSCETKLQEKHNMQKLKQAQQTILFFIKDLLNSTNQLSTSTQSLIQKKPKSTSQQRSSINIPITMQETDTHIIFKRDKMPPLTFINDSQRASLAYGILQKKKPLSDNDVYKIISGETIEGTLAKNEIKRVNNALKDLNEAFKRGLNVSKIIQTRGQIRYCNYLYKIEILN